MWCRVFYFRRIKSFREVVQYNDRVVGTESRFVFEYDDFMICRDEIVRCHVLLIKSQDVSLIRRDVLYTCGTICRRRSSDLSKDERRICAQLEVCNRWCYCISCSLFLFGSPVVRNSFKGIFSVLSVLSKLFSWEFCEEFLLMDHVIDLTYRTLLQRNMLIIRTRKIRIISKKKFEELSIDLLRVSQSQFRIMISINSIE